ncbi:hypothetical protein HPP92_010656 [Vanilla planifolia]|uniref:Reverse transcriptase domain-containing protein n=1 Tax=Vanilla planifolia TaxID=51239 RepID=A0A835UZZ9_VANPL|nr:hypothetical protein HPP92_010656 [Vanilla planifolia]
MSHFRGSGGSTQLTSELLRLIPRTVSASDNSILCGQVTPSEVKSIILSMRDSSAAGPDGFTVPFFKACWDVIGDDLTAAVNDFLVGTKLPRSAGAAWLCLIPKGSAVASLSDLRPIALCSVFGKLLSKVLANRLRPLLPSLISPEQTAFIRGRNIADNILLTQEMVHRIDRKRKAPNALFKLDIRSAFDRVSWRFLDAVLEGFGFSQLFRRLVGNSLDASWLSVLINGEPKGFFKPSCGVKQDRQILLPSALCSCLSHRLRRRLHHIHFGKEGIGLQPRRPAQFLYGGFGAYPKSFQVYSNTREAYPKGLGSLHQIDPGF